MLVSLLWSALLGLLLYQFAKTFLLHRRMPPGPYGLPVVGSMVKLLRTDAIVQINAWKDQYGNIFSMTLGNFNVIVISNYKLMQEALRRDEFTGRPTFEYWKRRNLGNQTRGLLFCDGGAVWQEQRRFAIRSLKDFGFGKESMEGLLVDELEELVKYMKKDEGKVTSLHGAFNGSVLNSLWYILTGTRHELDDPVFREAITLLIESMQQTPITAPGLFFPALLKYTLFFEKKKELLNKMRAKIYGMINKFIDEHFKTYSEDTTRDFMDSYIHQMGKVGNDKTSSFHSEEGKMNLRIVLLDLFVAGAETTSTTLQWAILCLILNPQVQDKLHEEIDTVIGKGRRPCRDDKPKMIYIEAFLNEVHRMASLVPMDVYHKVHEDTEFEGHFFPKESVLFLNIYDAHHNKEYWGDPENFRPERFLNPEGTELVKNEALMPFSTGKRQCLGETLARDTLFIFFTGLLQAYAFKLDPGTKPSELDTKGTPTSISSPKPYKVVFTSRN